ncbi:helix-turn-helix domain-containing protein [Flavobacterium sp. LB3P45]|uniref:Helix-turn-helix domain-containing protein n=1 Tax=Flavobacterium fructosi TaxID=3230416 RepID=A0ABW6HPZ8_9FLAO
MDKTLMLNMLQNYYGLNKDIDFASLLGISSQVLSNWKKRNTFDAELIYTKCLNINPEWLLTGNGDMFKKNISNQAHEPGEVYTLKTDRVLKEQSIPLYDLEATAGLVELFGNKNGVNKPIDYISIPNLPKCDGAIYVTGDSMYPLLKSGDIIIYKKVENTIDNIFFGEMYLVSIDLDGDEFVTAKWIHKSEKGEEFIKIVSQNSHHQPKDIHLSNVKAMALIKASIRINSMS